MLGGWPILTPSGEGCWTLSFGTLPDLALCLFFWLVLICFYVFQSVGAKLLFHWLFFSLCQFLTLHPKIVFVSLLPTSTVSVESEPLWLFLCLLCCFINILHPNVAIFQMCIVGFLCFCSCALFWDFIVSMLIFVAFLDNSPFLLGSKFPFLTA